jgi:hypothetical protein
MILFLFMLRLGESFGVSLDSATLFSYPTAHGLGIYLYERLAATKTTSTHHQERWIQLSFNYNTAVPSVQQP